MNVADGVVTADVSDVSDESGSELRAAGSATGVGRYRWRICGLLFFATTLNYMDRQALALLKPTLQSPTQGIGLTELQFAGIVSIFSAVFTRSELLPASSVS